MRYPHRLHVLRMREELSMQDLSDLSGISTSAIARIEDPYHLYKTHEGVAKALADALYVGVHDLFDPEELSHRGRPPMTGSPLQLVKDVPALQCPNCYLTLPRTLVCDECGDMSEIVKTG